MDLIWVIPEWSSGFPYFLQFKNFPNFFNIPIFFNFFSLSIQIPRKSVIHSTVAEHNFGIKVELDLKTKQRKWPKPIIILTSKEVIEKADRNPCKGRAN